MKREQVKDIFELIGIVAIIASLVFVGLEVRQSHEIARADVYQQRTFMEMQVNMSSYTPELLSTALETWRQNHSEMTSEEIRALATFWTVWVTLVENAHYQYQLGLLPDEEWQNQLELTLVQAQRPCFYQWWTSSNSIWRASFREVIQAGLDASSPAECQW
ncbi:MAG: hypothetical protein V2J20_02945 [Wenzhouxiangella sp.]|nr:hypothetical protein [Wenzhouxiangella sp.]